MPGCVHKVLDTADIVRDAIFHQLMSEMADNAPKDNWQALLPAASCIYRCTFGTCTAQRLVFRSADPRTEFIERPPFTVERSSGPFEQCASHDPRAWPESA